MIVVTIGVVACVLTGSVQAAFITSGEFSLGYGFAGDSWNTSETSGSNTATTLGDFSFVPTVTGLRDSTSGPGFAGRVLTDSGNSACGYVENGECFSASIVGSWSGSTPLDAAAIPNYQTTLEITSIRIWAHSWDTPAVANLSFHESTADHTGDSATIVPGTGGVTLPASFTHLIWDPTDFAVTGTSSTRTFGLAYTGGSREVPLDGFEVFGKVTLSYSAVPEPGTLVLLATGLLGLLAYAWRKRK